MSNPSGFVDRMKRELDRRRDETMKEDEIKELQDNIGRVSPMEESLNRIEDNLIEINSSLKEIIKLLTSIRKKRNISV